MSESEAPPGEGRGPTWKRNAGPSPSVASPAMAAPPPSHFTGIYGATVGSADEMFTARYSRNGVTPVPFAIMAILGMAAAWWTYDWSEVTREASDPTRVNEWWINVTAVILPGERIRLTAFSEYRMWVTLAVLVVAALLVAVWIGRIGSNVRSGHNPFGAFLPLVAFPAWWMVPVTIGLLGDSVPSHQEFMLRFLVAFGILFAQFLLVRWPTSNRIWRAGHLPYDMASIVLWLPMMIPWSMYFLSGAFTYLAIGSEGDPSDSSWQPTSTMLDWARWITRASMVGLLILLLVVTVLQHLGMAKDRADDDAARLAPPVLPPGLRPPGAASPSAPAQP